eukprot:GILJ01003546.1.p1 GENE.GILJ01003546.1~~GILJ01003546.1.p1  ORF type:complete len:1025 (-),score=122.06 GILJ01003546.1:1287-4361(-)
MACNPPLYSNGIPVPIAGEYMVLNRKGIVFSAKVPGMGTLSGSGVFYLSTLRIVFVATKSDGALPFQAFDIPLANIGNEKFNQPIFGANNMTFRVEPLWGSIPAPAEVKLTFKEGGCGTFLPLFFTLIEQIRTSIASQRPPAPDPRFVDAVRTGNIRNVAYIDPSDPSVVYISQPAAPPEQQLLSTAHYSPPPSASPPSMGMGMGMGSVLGGSPAKVNVPSVSVFTAAPTVTKEALSKVEGALHLDAFLEKAREHNIVFSDVHLGSIADKITHALHGEEVKAALVKAGSAATTVLSSVAKAIPLAVALKKLYDSCSSLVEEQNQMVEIRELLEKDRRQLALDTFKMCKTLLQLSIYEDKQIHLMSEFTVTVDRMLKSLSTSSAEFVNVLQDYDAPAFHAGLRAVCPHDKNLCWRLLQSYGVHHLGQVGVSAADVSIAFDALRYGAITDFAMIEWDASSSNKAGDLGTIGYVPLAVIPGAKRALWACRECSDHCIIDVRFSSKPRAACDELRRAHPSSSAALCRNMPFHDDIHLVYLQSVSGGHRVCLHDVFITHMKESADTVKQTGQFAALDYQRVSDRSAKSTSATDALHTGAMYAATGLAHVLTLGGLAIAKHGFGADTPLDFDKMGRYTFSSGLAAFSRTAPFGTSQRLDPRVEYQISVINPGCNIPEPYASLKYAAPIKEGVNAWLEPVARRSKAKCEEFYPLSSIDSFSDVIVCSTYYQKDYCDMLLDLGYRVVSYTGRKLDSVQVLTRTYSRAPGLSFSLNIGPRFDAYGRLMRGPEPPKVELSESEKILRTMGLLSEMFKLRLCSGECHFSDENPFPEWVNGRPINIKEYTSDMVSKKEIERENYSRKIGGILRFHPLEHPPATHTHAPVLVASRDSWGDIQLDFAMQTADHSTVAGNEYILQRFYCDDAHWEDSDDKKLNHCVGSLRNLQRQVKELSQYKLYSVDGKQYNYMWKVSKYDRHPIFFFEKIYVLTSYQVPTEREAVCKGSNLDPRVARYEFDQLIKGIQDDNKALLFR